MAPRGLGHSPAVRRGRMVQPRALLLCLSSLALVVAFVVVSRMADANGGDLPPEIRLQGFVRAEEGRLHLVARIPLVLLQGLDLPKWGPGYLQLAGIDERLKAAAAAAARDIVLFEGGRPLAPIRSETQISLPSDRSFDGYATALSHVRGPRLPVDTKVFWNQGYFDAHIEYPVRSGTDFALLLKISPGLGQRIKLRVQFLPMSGPSLIYELSGGAGRISLDPRWYEAAWIFARRGFSDVFVVDRLVFLVCLVAPFRQFWSLLMVVLALTGMQAVTSIADAVGAAPEVRWLPMLFESCLGAAVVLLAVENVVAPNLRRRWFVAAVVGALGGFGLGHLWAEQRQFAGAHTRVSLASFNLGVALGEVAALLVVVVVLRLLYAHVLGARLGVIIVSAMLGHMGWHWMLDGAHGLRHATSAGVWTAPTVAVAWWLVMGLLVGAAAWFLPERFDTHADPVWPHAARVE